MLVRAPIIASLAALLAVLACGGGSRTTQPAPVTPGTPTQRVKTIPAGPYTTGVSYFGRASYIEYVPGTLPIIITAPHGGTLRPSELPDRLGGTTVSDLNTDTLARTIASALQSRTGKRPHLVITRLHRVKIDTNRDSAEATEGNGNAVTAWFEFHDFLDVARAAVNASSPAGFYLDIHGHGHTVQRLELGYLLTDAELNATNSGLDGSTAFERKSSIRWISERSPLSFSDLLRGSASLGALFAAEGFPSVPSPQATGPGTEPYFDGGYNTSRYTCAASGTICGIQIEANLTGVRDTEANRIRFAAAVAKVVDTYLRSHAGINITP
jgi:hypothetical protein